MPSVTSSTADQQVCVKTMFYIIILKVMKSPGSKWQKQEHVEALLRDFIKSQCYVKLSCVCPCWAGARSCCELQTMKINWSCTHEGGVGDSQHSVRPRPVVVRLQHKRSLLSDLSGEAVGKLQLNHENLCYTGTSPLLLLTRLCFCYRNDLSPFLL